MLTDQLKGQHNYETYALLLSISPIWSRQFSSRKPVSILEIVA